MKIESLEIHDVGGIHNLFISFNPGLNLICGMNGVGKSTILECIVNTFSFSSSNYLKKNSRAEKGEWTTTIDGISFTNELRHFTPLNNDSNSSFVGESQKVIYIKEQRYLQYQFLESVRSDSFRGSNHHHGSNLVHGLKTDFIKSWFINRVAFEHQGKYTEAELYNINLAKECFNLLDKNIEYSHVLHDTLDIMINTSRGEVYLEYLSSGFKSCLVILLGIISEIEFNFKNPKIKVSEFDGVILIDEADAHLHPHWQGVFINILKSIFQQAQIIVTTHSPHMIQEADAEEIIAMSLDKNGEVILLPLPQSEYGFKGWTIEEILEDVMGLRETQSNYYVKVKKEFEDAVDSEDIVTARRSYDILEQMLHPRSPMRKIYQLQLGSIG